MRSSRSKLTESATIIAEEEVAVAADGSTSDKLKANMKKTKVKGKDTKAKHVESKEAEQENDETASTFLSECEKVFGQRDLYAILNLTKETANETAIKKGYYKCSLKFHPDKATEESEKESCKHKFQILGRVYSILSDADKRKQYDDYGIIDGEDELFSFNKDWESYFRALFKKVTTEDMDAFFATYKNSEEEKLALCGFYEEFKGDMNNIMENMFSSDSIVDEQRFKEILLAEIEKGTVVKYDIFVKEDKKKANKRKANAMKEAEEAEEIAKEKGIDESQDSLRLAISARGKKNENFLDGLLAKYSKIEEDAKTSKATKKSRKGKSVTKNQQVDEKKEEEDEEEEDSDYEAMDDSEQAAPSKKSSVLKKKAPKRKNSVKRL